MREEGYYWVLHSEGWELAYYYDISGYQGWRAIGSDIELQDDDWFQIDERRIVREVE